ncbi:MAG: hypothetical protein JRN24_02645 [Nitrososphaerota archaeon]|nr:hypothetical protein [Nitrososphaerota archaeon]
MRVLYGVSPIGLGHASRAVAVGAELKARGAEVTFACAGYAGESIRSNGFQVEDAITAHPPRFVGTEMKDASVWYLRYWSDLRRNKRTMTEIVEKLSPDLVVGDEEFSGLEVALERGIRRVMISDELELGFARTWLARRIESRAERWYGALMLKMDLLIVPDEGKDSGNVCHVGPIVRSPTKSREEVLAELGIGRGRKVILVSLSGAGVGGDLVARAALTVRGDPSLELVVSGNRGERLVGERVHDLGMVRENQNLVAASDLVISTAGKSTIDEALANGTSIIVIPIKNHAEQERNASALGFSSKDAGRLEALVREKVGKRTEPRPFDGARKAAELLLSAAD